MRDVCSHHERPTVCVAVAWGREGGWSITCHSLRTAWVVQDFLFPLGRVHNAVAPLVACPRFEPHCFYIAPSSRLDHQQRVVSHSCSALRTIVFAAQPLNVMPPNVVAHRADNDWRPHLCTPHASIAHIPHLFCSARESCAALPARTAAH